MPTPRAAALCLLGVLVLVLAGRAAAAQVTAPALKTRWAGEVRAGSVLPEYPRPQLVRPAWQNLNGLWEYAVRDSGAAPPQRFDGTILVPFPIESQLSGVRRRVTEHERLWYRRTFQVLPTPAGTRWLLHFGAVDWAATVYVSGRRIGEHRGGYDPFTLDITTALRPGPDQTLVVGVWDPTDRGDQPRGKQVLAPHSIWYSAVTGIWQTVWLEPVPRAYISALRIASDAPAGTVSVTAAVTGGGAGLRLRAVARAGDSTVAEEQGPARAPLTLRIPNARLWSPDDPFLYGLRISLTSGDSVESYFGMRQIAVAPDSAGALRLALNGSPLFQFGTLDQGWWPDGLYTAPTDEALRSDLETLKRLGFNAVRKHVKVEPERWYFHCDRLGLLVWQDMPSGDNKTVDGRREFADELRHVIDALRDHPSIVMWVPFNEGWGQHDTQRHVTWLVQYDPTRLVDNASGWTDEGVGQVADVHAYPGPAIPPRDGRRARVLGEFGGLGLPLAGHTWLGEGSWGYRKLADSAQLAAAYRELLYQLRFLEGDGLAAAIYTQTTDVESEVNGLLTYDRAIVKLPAEAAAWNRRLYGPPPARHTVVPTSETEGQPWRYTTEAPAGDWFATEFDDSAWRRGTGGFGTSSTPGAAVHTVWKTSDIWLRRTFELGATPLVNPHWRIHHAEDAEVYVNGELVARFAGSTGAYVMLPLEPHALATLRSGRNTLAVHVHQTTRAEGGQGGQYIDVGLDEVIDR